LKSTTLGNRVSGRLYVAFILEKRFRNRIKKLIKNGKVEVPIVEQIRCNRAPPTYLTSIYKTIVRMGESRDV
jgi:hypothetical protein